MTMTFGARVLCVVHMLTRRGGLVLLLATVACGGAGDVIDAGRDSSPDSPKDAPTHDASVDVQPDVAVDAATLFPCTSGSPGLETGDGSKVTLLTNLEYPSALWVRGNTIYFTETAARMTSYGGALRLSSYDVTSKQTSLLVNNPMNSDAVVVASDGSIYLGSWATSSPGSSGNVSVVNPITLVETFVVHLDVAVQDMFIDSADNIYVIGPNDSGDNLFLLPAGNYTTPVLLEANLGRSWAITESGCDLYYAMITGGPLHRIHDTGYATPWGPQARNGLSPSSTYLYYADSIAGSIGRADLATAANAGNLLTALNTPNNVRYAAGALYYVEGGTDAAHYKDGTLAVVYPKP